MQLRRCVDHAAIVCYIVLFSGDKYRLSAYSNANACVLFLPLIAYWELDTLYEYAHFFLSPVYWCMLLVSGIGGFAIGIVAMLQIQVRLVSSYGCAMYEWMSCGQLWTVKLNAVVVCTECASLGPVLVCVLWS